MQLDSLVSAFQAAVYIFSGPEIISAVNLSRSRDKRELVEFDELEEQTQRGSRLDHVFFTILVHLTGSR